MGIGTETKTRKGIKEKSEFAPKRTAGIQSIAATAITTTTGWRWCGTATCSEYGRGQCSAATGTRRRRRWSTAYSRFEYGNGCTAKTKIDCATNGGEIACSHGREGAT